MPSNIQQPVKGKIEKEKKLKRVTSDTVRQAKARFEKYKDARASLNQRLIDSEQFWKMRHWEGKSDKEEVNPTGWLLNAVHSKHADMMDGYPEPSIRAKEEGDVAEAKTLSQIIPVILEQTGLKKTYSKVCRDKINKGTGVYGVFWDNTKHFGMGDVSIEKINLLNLYFEPGVDNIQKSREVFLLQQISKDDALSRWPQLSEGQLSSGDSFPEYINEESVDSSDKVVVFDWYYKRWNGNDCKLHYCKFLGDTVLYASEDDEQVPMSPVINPMTNEPSVDSTGQPVMQQIGNSIAETGWYAHGKFPFVLDTMFQIDDSAFGYGLIDLFKSTQEDIDLLNHAVVKNALICSKPRYFAPVSSGINLEDFTDLTKDIINYEGTVNDLIPVQAPAMPGMVVEIMNNKIEELKEVSGNRDVNNGSTSSGVTAAAAIAALQEHAGKTSRDNIQGTYEEAKEVTYLVIDLIRQFYDTPRQFRITGDDGTDVYMNYSNEGIKPQAIPAAFGVDKGYRVPQFDIVVSTAKSTAYSKLSQNELALQLYSAGLFAPQNSDAALATVELMDFDDKDKVKQTISRNGTLFEQNKILLQTAMGLAMKFEPATAHQLANSFGIQAPPTVAARDVDTQLTETNADGTLDTGEHSGVKKARERSLNSTQVG